MSSHAHFGIFNFPKALLRYFTGLFYWDISLTVASMLTSGFKGEIRYRERLRPHAGPSGMRNLLFLGPYTRYTAHQAAFTIKALTPFPRTQATSKGAAHCHFCFLLCFLAFSYMQTTYCDCICPHHPLKAPLLSLSTPPSRLHLNENPSSSTNQQPSTSQEGAGLLPSCEHGGPNLCRSP